MSKAAVAMLKGLLAQIEAGELVVTDASVTGETVELQGGNVRPTGEENWYITTRSAAPTPEAPKVAAVIIGNLSAGSNSSSAPALVHRPYNAGQVCDEVGRLIEEYLGGHIRIAELYDRAAALFPKLTKAISSYSTASREYAQLVRAAACLQRVLYV